MEREAHFQRGARFFKGEDGNDMFEYRADSSTVIGPRVATKDDKQNHKALWLAYLATRTDILRDAIVNSADAVTETVADVAEGAANIIRKAVKKRK